MLPVWQKMFKVYITVSVGKSCNVFMVVFLAELEVTLESSFYIFESSFYIFLFFFNISINSYFPKEGFNIKVSISFIEFLENFQI